MLPLRTLLPVLGPLAGSGGLAQFGSRLARSIPQATLERGLGVLFALIATLTLFEAFTG